MLIISIRLSNVPIADNYAYFQHSDPHKGLAISLFYVLSLFQFYALKEKNKFYQRQSENFIITPVWLTGKRQHIALNKSQPQLDSKVATQLDTESASARLTKRLICMYVICYLGVENKTSQSTCNKNTKNAKQLAPAFST